MKAAGNAGYWMILRVKFATSPELEPLHPVLETVVFATTVTTCVPNGV